MVAGPFLAERAQHLLALLLGEHAGEGSVLAQILSHLVLAGEDSHDRIDARREDLLPLIQGGQDPRSVSVQVTPACDVVPGDRYRPVRVTRELTNDRSVQP